MSKQLTYIPRTSQAADLLTFIMPEIGDVILIKEKPTIVDNKVVEYLAANEQEYNLCVEQKIIIVENVIVSEAGAGATKTATTK